MNAQNEIEERTKILAAANWKSESENTYFGDNTYRAFIQVMTYRREVAKRYLQEQSEESQKQIKAVLNNCNEQIKQILGL